MPATPHGALGAPSQASVRAEEQLSPGWLVPLTVTHLSASPHSSLRAFFSQLPMQILTSRPATLSLPFCLVGIRNYHYFYVLSSTLVIC